MQKIKGVQHVTVDQAQSGRRIDNFLQYQLKGIPKTRIYQMIRKGEVRLNGSRVKQNQRINLDDIVRIPPVSLPEKDSEQPQFSKQLGDKLIKNILFEDENLLILNKPSGLVVHAGSGQKSGVIEYLRYLRTELEFLELAHRLDRDTSGCLVLAKSPVILKEIQSALTKQKTQKSYLAFVKGRLASKFLEVSQPLRKNTLAGGERMVRVDPAGKTAITRFHQRQVTKHGSLLDVELVTGRTHQIRVHASYIGHPIAMDQKYGDKEYNKTMKRLGLNRLFLHAKSIELSIPGYPKPLVFEAPLDEMLETFLAKM